MTLGIKYERPNVAPRQAVANREVTMPPPPN